MRTDRPALTPEQRNFILATAANHLALWQRVDAGMERQNFNWHAPERRAVTELLHVLGRLAHKPVAKTIWRTPRARGDGAELRDQQLAWLRAVALDARRDLQIAASYFDQHAWPSDSLQRQIHAAMRELDVGMILHYATCGHVGHETRSAANPEIWCCDGI